VKFHKLFGRNNAMLKRLIVLLAVLVLLVPVSARAQSAITLLKAEVDLWPEYDRPDMLVIYHLTLPSTVSLPYEMTVRIPAAVGDPSAVAARQPDGSLFNIPFTRQVNNDWSLVTFRATTSDIQIEYYDSSLHKNGADRHFVFSWPGDYAVTSLVVQVQQPVDATDMQISPNLGGGQTGSDSLTYYTAEEGAMTVGQSFTITLDYKKSTDKLSASIVQVQSSAPLSTTTPSSRFTWTSVLPWVLGILGVLLIVGGGTWYWWSGREKSTSAPRRLRRKPAAAEANPAKGDSDGGFIYCHNCGKRANPGDRFCRTCGTALRTGG
jgi:zinc-ribbon domain